MGEGNSGALYLLGCHYVPKFSVGEKTGSDCLLWDLVRDGSFLCLLLHYQILILASTSAEQSHVNILLLGHLLMSIATQLCENL